MKRTLPLLLIAAIAFAISPNASAEIFQWTWDGNGAQPNGAGNPSDISATYDTETEQLLWSATFDADVAGVSLVLTPGPAPTANANDEVAILYMNLNAELAAYAYSDRSGTDSYMTEPVIQTANDPSWQNNVFVQDNTNTPGSTLSRTYSADIDASTIQAFGDTFTPPSTDWTGVAFGNELGISLHWWKYAWTAFDDDGTVANCWGAGRCAREGYLELTNQCTVPEPSAAMLILLSGLLPFTLRRRITPKNARA